MLSLSSSSSASASSSTSSSSSSASSSRSSSPSRSFEIAASGSKHDSADEKPLEENSLEELLERRRCIMALLNGSSQKATDVAPMPECPAVSGEVQRIAGDESSSAVGQCHWHGASTVEPLPGCVNGDAAAVDVYSDSELYQMLEQGLEDCKNAGQLVVETSGPSPKRAKLEEPKALVKKKHVLRWNGAEYFEVLPDGWIEITHKSGLPVYLHRESRVCSMSRPYFLGPGSARNHDVPLSSIPCMLQVRMKKEAAQKRQAAQTVDADLVKKLNIPETYVQTIDDYNKRNVSAEELHEYAKTIFDFETIEVKRFKSWADHRAYHKKLKREKNELLMSAVITGYEDDFSDVVVEHQQQQQQQQQQQVKEKSSEVAWSISSKCEQQQESSRPKLPPNVKLITVPNYNNNRSLKKQFVLNPQGKTSIAVLHEYVQKVLRGLVKYEFSETRNATNPFAAVVKLITPNTNVKQTGPSNGLGAGAGGAQAANDGGAAEATSEMTDWVTIGVGNGNSKKNAKLEAARQALKVLIPGVDFNLDGQPDSTGEQDEATKLFDLIAINDSRVPELCSKAGQPMPFIILQECIKRNASLSASKINMNIERVKHQLHAFTLSVGTQEVRVLCMNKKEGKQKASQAMLERLHPHIKSWGALIRLYGYGAQRQMNASRKEKANIVKMQAESKQQHRGGGGGNAEDWSSAEKAKLWQSIEKGMMKVWYKEQANGHLKPGHFFWDYQHLPSTSTTSTATTTADAHSAS
ncbi:Microprocessor complex subunit DGCR8 [Trichinella zimbabwensis]|uniref:Microprocessor complex subunit DGCR8 n=1 Tax=Trichinella zimbabwensis TaxID=268475 RepID=A0A0V1IA10_9BILA|nr:Microprocessor complex subunit DGCR8 [Trichinella zimbabwensis]